jgi:hypothetical protein
VTKIKIMLCALALSGCSAGVQPTFPDLGMSEADGGTSDAPDAGPGEDAGLEPDAGVDQGEDSGGDRDLGPDPDLGPAPDAGPPPCITLRELCADSRCCNEPCMGGICRFGHAVSGNFCMCEYVTCPAGATVCDNGLSGVCACP